MGYGSRSLWRLKREREAAERLAPCDRSGYVYYARLKTDLGTFYKLGYTKASSLEDRFGYGGSVNAQFIDKVFCFVHMEDAFDVETQLHRHFSSRRAFGIFSSNPDLPLYKSGQGELYYSDILGFDKNYSRLRRIATFFRVGLRIEATRTGNPILGLLKLAIGTVVGAGILLALLPFALAVHWFDERQTSQAQLTRRELGSSRSQTARIQKLIDLLKANYKL